MKMLQKVRVSKNIFKKPHENWNDAFIKMAENNDDVLLDQEMIIGTKWDSEEWKW